MKTLHLIRHAKSSWENPALPDIERPLNQRGRQSCLLMAEAVLQAGCDFNYVFCSVATRAQQTIQGLKAALPSVNIEWTLDDALYTFSEQHLLLWCQQLNNNIEDVTVVGHNPAITSLCNTLTGESISNVPTCAYVQITFPGEHWCKLEAGSANLLTFLRPKMLRKN